MMFFFKSLMNDHSWYNIQFIQVLDNQSNICITCCKDQSNCIVNNTDSSWHHFLAAYTYVDFAEDLNDRKSRSGSILLLNQGPVHWLSRKRTLYCFVRHGVEVCCCFAPLARKWCGPGVFFLGIPQPKPTPLLSDNHALPTPAGGGQQWTEFARSLPPAGVGELACSRPSHQRAEVFLPGLADPVIGEILGHNRVRPYCLQVQPVTRWHPPVFLGIGVYSINSSKMIGNFPSVLNFN